MTNKKISPNNSIPYGYRKTQNLTLISNPLKVGKKVTGKRLIDLEILPTVLKDEKQQNSCTFMDRRYPGFLGQGSG
jgi:hypothetical protein